MPNYVHGYVLYTRGLEEPMWYIQGGMVAVRTVGLGTRNLELGVPLGSVEHGRWVVGDLWATLSINPNPNRILLLHLLVTFNTDPQSVMVQQVGQQKREGVVGGSVLASIENLSIGVDGSSKGESAVELVDVGLKEWQVLFRMFCGICTSLLIWTGLARQAGPVHFIDLLSTPLQNT